MQRGVGRDKFVHVFTTKYKQGHETGDLNVRGLHLKEHEFELTGFSWLRRETVGRLFKKEAAGFFETLEDIYHPKRQYPVLHSHHLECFMSDNLSQQSSLTYRLSQKIYLFSNRIPVTAYFIHSCNCDSKFFIWYPKQGIRKLSRFCTLFVSSANRNNKSIITAMNNGPL
jgi:hypothetical protein